MRSLGDRLSYGRLCDVGVALVVVNQSLTERISYFGTPERVKAIEIDLEEIISRRTRPKDRCASHRVTGGPSGPVPQQQR
jgi:hypothetical protein